jgi:hypothetical protein
MDKISTDQTDILSCHLTHKIKSEFVTGKTLYALYPNAPYFSNVFLKNIVREYLLVDELLI